MITTVPETCDVCGAEPSVGVVSVPGVPCSMSYGRRCIDAGAHPWGILVANTACIGGLQHAAPWWKTMVEDTCRHLGKTIDEFNRDVDASLKEFP